MRYCDLLARLANNVSTITNNYGLRIKIKSIPDGESGGLDPRVRKVFDEAAASKAKPFGPGMSLQELRDAMGWPNSDVTSGSVKMEPITINGRNGEIPLRIYRGSNIESAPCILFFHGGGFFGGSVDCVENPCKCLAIKAGATVISVDYRLAPEHPYPEGSDDCYDALTWAYQNPDILRIDRSKIGVCGDSAGGNLATVCALRDRDGQTGMVRFQGLIYPAIDNGAIKSDEYKWDISEFCITRDRELVVPSIFALGENPNLIMDIYLSGDADKARSPYASPIYAETLEGMPATLIINAEYDYLRLEGEAYGRKLVRDGVKVSMLRYNGMDHGFIDKLGLYPQAEDVMIEIAKAFRSAVTP